MLLGLSLVALWIVSTPVCADWLTWRLELQFPPVRQKFVLPLSAEHRSPLIRREAASVSVVRLEVCLKASGRAAMPKKRHKPEEIVAKLRQVDVLASQAATDCSGAVSCLQGMALCHKRFALMALGC